MYKITPFHAESRYEQEQVHPSPEEITRKKVDLGRTKGRSVVDGGSRLPLALFAVFAREQDDKTAFRRFHRCFNFSLIHVNN
jgi:hypothetical protein